METKKLSWWKALALSAVGALKLASNADAQEAKLVENPLQPIKQESPINITSRTDFFSKYVYRGMAFSEKPVIQQNIKATYKGFTLWGFGNYDTETGKINEEDLIIDYTTPINNKVFLSAGYGAFTFPNTDFKKTQEFYVGTSLDTFLNPNVFFFHDFKEGKGNYIEASVSENFNLGKIPISATTKLAYNNHYYRKDSGFSHLELSLASPISIRKNTTLSPSITYQKALDKKDFDNELYGGISLEHKF